MYERSAIVLERFFSNVLGYSSENNLKINFDNYCKLIEKLDDFQKAYGQEQITIQAFNDVTEFIREVQKKQDKLYKKNAKLEYNRNLLFNNVEENPEETERCILKIESEIEENILEQKELSESFINAINEFNERRIELNNSKKERKIAENNYNEVFEIANENAKNINEFKLEFARNFKGAEVKEKLINLMLENGKNEKIPFDENVIDCAVDLSLEVAQKEIECYVDMYDNIMRLFDEIEKNCIKLDKFKKRMRNTKVKLNFLFAVKDYLVQFLDYERMTVINGKKTHKKLMEEACENFKSDVIQINNLYELILREIATKSTKKGYKELYNKSYLLNIKEKEENFKKESDKVDLNVGTVLNSNYWRIEGIQNIYTVFYNDVIDAFGRDLDEFEVQEEEDVVTEAVNIEETVKEEVIEVTGIEKVEQEKVNMFENFVDDEVVEETTPYEFEDDEGDEFAESQDIENIEEEAGEFDIFGSYADKVSFDEQEDDDEAEETEGKKQDSIFDADIPYEEEEDISYEEEDEESLLGNIKGIKKMRRNAYDLDGIVGFEKEKKAKKTKSLFSAFKKINNKDTKKVTN